MACADVILQRLQSPPHELPNVSRKVCAGKLRDYVLEEGNVRVLKTCSDPERYCSTRAEPVFSALGQRLGKAMGPVGKAIKALGPAQVGSFAVEVGLTAKCVGTIQKAGPGHCVACGRAAASALPQCQGHCGSTHPC